MNDAFRISGAGGILGVTPGIKALGEIALALIVDDIRFRAEFSVENDPHGEHDFGVVLHVGQRIFWKIDYYDVDLRFGSPDPADPAVTTRVLTVLLAEEY